MRLRILMSEPIHADEMLGTCNCDGAITPGGPLPDVRCVSTFHAKIYEITVSQRCLYVLHNQHFFISNDTQPSGREPETKKQTGGEGDQDAIDQPAPRRGRLG